MKLIYKIVVVAAIMAGFLSCKVTSHPVKKMSFEKSIKMDSLNTKPNVKVKFAKLTGAEFTTDRSGLINFDHPRAKDLKDGLEQAQMYLFTIDHHTMGRYIIDTGIAESIAKDTEDNPIPWFIKKAFNMDSAKIFKTTKSYMESSKPIKGLFLTHLHMDHLMGLPDLPKDIKIYAGPGEADTKLFQNVVVQGTTDDLLNGFSAINEMIIPKEGEAIDFFGDKSLLIFWVPGHTAGSLAFLVRAEDGNHFLTGDSCHTAWGWRNSVAPGKFTVDHKSNQKYLEWMIGFVKNSKEKIIVHLGHQILEI